LILLAKGLAELGHNIFMMANQYDKNVIDKFVSKIISVPVSSDSYLNLNEYTAEWLNKTWNEHFDSHDGPDVVLVGGWPFFSSIPFFKKVCKKVIFVDFGAVPLDGYSGGALVTQEKLRSLRKQYLLDASLIIGISNFIANSQSKVDSCGRVPVKTVLLGADHMEMSIWHNEDLNLEKSHGNITDSIKKYKRDGRHILLCLGRWEPNCYKNSDATFDIMRKITKTIPNCMLFILSNPSDIDIPQDLENSIVPIGFPDDSELMGIMNHADLGISVSLWEGFNLPIAEMQWLGRPVLAFDIGAHPEVITHPWYLCKNNAEMAAKACKILSGQGLDSVESMQSLERFRNYFGWHRVIREYDDIIQEMANNEININKSSLSISLIIDVTNATKDPANSGVIRVTRRLSQEFQRSLDPIFVVWDGEKSTYLLPTKKEYEQLGKYNGPLITDEGRVSPDDHKVHLSDYISLVDSDSIWLLFTETVDERHASLVRRYAKDIGVNLAAIFYDAIPVLHPDLCKDALIKDNHVHYMEGLSECDVVIPISKFSSDCLEKFWSDNNIIGCPLCPNLLPGEFGGSERTDSVQNPTKDNRIQILCVSTLEPRKNHRKLVDACLLMQKEHPDLDWCLTLVGNRYAGADDIADFITQTSVDSPRIEWLGVVDDAKLHQLYKEATFTVYPSIVEGFGMPILESIWHGRPCICHQEGVMVELAEEGGCLTTDVTDVRALSEAIYRLAADRDLLIELSKQAVSRKIKTWDEYAREFISVLKSQTNSLSMPKRVRILMGNGVSWEDILYPKCLCENWQMNPSERLALTGLLSRHKPKCSIEIGTYMGGSLSLISQYSDMVFSIDVDSSIPERLGQFENVCFLTGPSHKILPILFKELDEEQIPVDFVLIDGDHSAEGIKRDIEFLLSYEPQKPLFVMMHDSFNPERRRGMLEVDWEKSPYVQWVDIDFIPGRLIDDVGPTSGGMWGGLALAYLKPTARQGPLDLNCSARVMYEVAKNLMI